MSTNFNYLYDFSFSAWHGQTLGNCHAIKPETAIFNAATDMLALTITLPFACTHQEALKAELLTYIQQHQPTVTSLSLRVEFVIKEHERTGKQGAVPGVKNIIAVSSAKGGVGKSSVTVNLAYALAQAGVRVGILDADVYGPSIPHMLGVSELQPTSEDQKTMNPVPAGKIVANSIGFLVGETDPTIWRGPVASGMLKQLMAETNWPNLDYLLIDMPPGTGDIQLTVTQNLSINAAIVVSTPQEIALLDVLKGVNMFHKLDVPVLGVVENMSMYTCPNCGYQAHIFGQDGVKEMSEILGVDLLASLPLNPKVGQLLDDGKNIVEAYPNLDISQAFLQLADNVAFSLYQQVKTAAPTISIKQL